jgi:hypothetical protein
VFCAQHHEEQVGVRTVRERAKKPSFVRVALACRPAANPALDLAGLQVLPNLLGSADDFSGVKNFVTYAGKLTVNLLRLIKKLVEIVAGPCVPYELIVKP